MSPGRADLLACVQRWIANETDPAAADELRALVAAGDLAELSDRFSGRPDFGTAGLRAPMRAGPNGMNRRVVRESAAGMARYLTENVPRCQVSGVVVAHDARHHSEDFAADCAEVIASYGIPVHRLAGAQPTPVAVFAIRALAAAAGVVITASHNPAGDNGLKLYLGDGVQIRPPVDGAVAKAIDTVVAENTTMGPGPVAVIDEIDPGVIDRYDAATLGRVPAPTAGIRIAVTAMHGVGGDHLVRLLRRAGHADVASVTSQHEPDPDFPTVGFPNPEEPGACDRLAALMSEVRADLGLALDPDADRLAVLVPDRDGTPRQLTGDEVGALLGEWLLTNVTGEADRLTVSSVVSSSLLGKIAAHHGARHEVTLTGFKWLALPALEHPDLTQVLAYEEAIGYAVGPGVTDKDGLGAAVAVAAMASTCADAGRGLLDLLDDIHRTHGAHVTDNASLRYPGADWPNRRAELMRTLAERPPDQLGGLAVTAIGWVAPDVLRLDLEQDVRALVRPSGTEPKIKCYCEAVVPVGRDGLDAARHHARSRAHAVRFDLQGVLAGPGHDADGRVTESIA